MASDETNNFREIMANLKRPEHRPEALTEIKNFLTTKPALEAASTIKVVGISNILKCLNDKNKSHVDLTCEVLQICFEKFNTGDVIRNFTSNFMYLIRHEKTCVRKLAIDEVYKTVTLDPNLLPVPAYIDVFVAVAQLVCDDDVGISNKAVLITSNIPNDAYPKVLDEMKIALEFNSSIKCNAYEVVVNISSKSPELLNLCAQQGYFDHMLNELQTDDLLYQLNILELLTRLALKPHGIGFLVKNGAIKKIGELVEKLSSNPLKTLLAPGYIKFFGCIAHNYPKDIFEQYPVFLNFLFEELEEENPTLLPVTLDTLGFIGTTIEGKLCLAAVGSKFIVAVQKVCQFIKNSPTEIKIRSLYCFANLISVDKDPKGPKYGPIDPRVTLMTREWFRSLNSQPESMVILFEICKNPFPDIRMAALSVLDAVCQHPWGEEAVARTAGMVEYLLDRTVDPDKQSKEAKFEIIKRLSRSMAFDENTLSRLQSYVDQGPFFSETTFEVAMEEGGE